MRVLVLGDKNRTGLGRSYARAFRALEAEVQYYDTSQAYRTALLGGQSRLLRRVLSPVLKKAYNAKVRKDMKHVGADLVFVSKGQHLRPDTIRWLRDRTGAPVVNFYPDDPFSNARSNRLTYGTEVLGSYSACFTFAKHLVSQYREAGAQKVFYLPFARDPQLHAPPDNAPARTSYDVVFVGNLDKTRVAWLEPLVEAKYRLVVYGDHTREAIPLHSALRDADFFPAAYGADLAHALHRGAISINVMRCQNEKSHNMRSFESPSCGAFTLSQRTPELVELFDERKEIACFGSPEELHEEVEYWLAHPAERCEVAEAGFRRVEHDTYCRRAETIFEKLHDEC